MTKITKTNIDRREKNKRVRDIDAYQHQYDAYVRMGGQSVNLADLTNHDFKRALVDILVHRGLLAGVKTPHRLEIERLQAEREKS